MTFQPPSREQLKIKAEHLQNLADLIQEYPAEAQLIMATLEKGLAIGPQQIVEDPAPIVIQLDQSGELHVPE